ncbi:MAG: TRAP transporter substrate-binding protein [Desulfosudaceae bacterium]
MNLQKSIVSLTAAFILTALLALPGQARPIELNYSIFFPASHVQSQAAEDWTEAINQKTDGDVKITTFPGGTLTSAKETYDSVTKGIADIGMSCFAYTRGRFPVMEAVDLPMGYPDGLTASRVANDFYQAFSPEELDNVKVLYLHAHGPGLLHTRKPVTKLEDIKGMKIRSTGLSSKIVKALDGVPVAMSQGETYESLKKGVVEGTFGPMEVLKGWRQAEVINSTTECASIGYTTAMFVVMNRDKWDSLSPEQQAVFEETSQEWIDVHGLAWDEADLAGRKYTRELDNTIESLSEEQSAIWKDRVQPVIDDYTEKADEKGLDGTKYVNKLRQLIDDLR